MTRRPTKTDPSSSGSASPLDALVRDMRSAVVPFRATLRDLHDAYRGVLEGEVANYIPELADADPNWFGISAVTTRGEVFEVGDSQRGFSIQSVSKPFVYGLALAQHGRERVLERVGVEPSGESFNSIELDPRSNRPFNPMVNAGAIAITDLIEGADYPDRVRRLLESFSVFAGREVYVDNAVFFSERETGHRNRAIAHLMRNFDAVGDHFEDSLELYFQQCSALVTATDLATMGATLANGGINPRSGQTALPMEHVKDVLSVMLSCGMYDYAGEWIYRVGVPAKSGVSGAIVVVLPGVMGLAIYSPPVDEKGNSVRGIRLCEELADRFGLHAFAPAGEGEDLGAQLGP